MKKLILLASLLFAMPAFADDQKDIDALTSDGKKVVLHADGQWEYVKIPTAEEVNKGEAPAVSAKHGCPPGWQGGAFGIGRCIPPGDKDFNRGSLRSQ